jgi:hypothetical protein
MDFAAMFQTWINVLTKPGEATFEEELHKPSATLGTALIWIIIAAVVAAIFSAIGALIGGLFSGLPAMMETFMGQSDMPPEVAAQLATITAVTAGGGVFFALCATLILAPIGFLIGSGIYFVVAKLVGGAGSFEKHTYMLATFTAPLMMVNAVISIIPILGGCVSFAIYIYQIVLTYFAMKVTHNLTTGKAIIVAVMPFVIGLLCAAVIIFLIFITIFGTVMSSGSY